MRLLCNRNLIMDLNNDPIHLKQVIFKLESELEDVNVEKAEQQLTGFIHAKRGYNLTTLVDSMGLTEKEWNNIKFNASILGLNENEVSEIDEYFKK